MRHALSCFLLLVLAATNACLQAAEPDVTDNTIVLGQRVGLIKPGMNSADLERIYGKGSFKLAELPGPEATTLAGGKLFEGTDRELGIVWHPEDESKKIVGEVIVVGKAWKFENGLKAGLSLAEVEKINGGPFKVNGFGWDLGGWANFEGGRLADKVTVFFDIPPSSDSEAVSGDKVLPSNHKALRAAKPFVAERIAVIMR